MSFFVPTVGPAQIVQASLGPNSLLFNDDMVPFYSSVPTVAEGRSAVGGTEILIYDSITPGIIYNLLYAVLGNNLSNTRIRISDSDQVNLWNITGMAPGVANRGGFLLGGPASLAVANSIYAASVPFKRLKIYVTTQFIDVQSQIIIGANMVRRSA